MVKKRIKKVKKEIQATLEKQFIPADPGFRRRAHGMMCIR